MTLRNYLIDYLIPVTRYPFPEAANMPPQSDRRPSLWPLACALLAGVLLASWMQPSRPSPWSPGPIPDPHTERPVIAAIVRLAKSVGWMLVFAEPPPAPSPSPEPTPVEAEPEAEIGSDGYPVCRHEKGW